MRLSIPFRPWPFLATILMLGAALLPALAGETPAPATPAPATPTTPAAPALPPAPPDTLLRGPYLCVGTPTSVIVRWRTSTPGIGRLWVGADLKNLQPVDETAATTEHELTAAGLKPDTRYFYRVGIGDKVLAGLNGDCSFATNPAPNAAKPTRIWVLGDSGTGAGEAMAVRNAFASYNNIHPTDLWLMLGDNAYNTGTDAEYQKGVFNMYPETLRTSVLWPTRGNHDVVRAGPDNDYYDLFTMPAKAEAGGVASGTEAYYAFNYGRIHFICLDSEGTSLKEDSPMWTWLKQDLAQIQQDWIIAFWHHPPYSKGSHDSDKENKLVGMREQALPILEAGGVDLVLSGHSHCYERSVLLDGHYGKSETLTDAMKKNKGNGKVDGDGAYAKSKLGVVKNEGAVYVVAGSSGTTSGGPLNHPAMFISLDRLGSMILDVNGNHLDAMFIEPGPKVTDTFRIVKGGAGKDTTPPALVAAVRVDATHVDLAFSEKLDPKTAEDPKLFRLFPFGAVGQAPPPPHSAKLLPDGQTVRLEQSGLDGFWKSWTANANGVTDPAGNLADPKISIEFPMALPVASGIKLGSTWKYDASGTDLKEAWRKADFDDSKWLSGPGQLGYGDGDEATSLPKETVRPSYYFRKKFTVDGKLAAAKLTTIQDDGIIVWINGQQVFSKHADKGADFASMASKGSDDNEVTKTDLKLDPNPFVAGENIICVMVKQAGLTSSDLSFDLQLDLTTAP